jgi:hypothetical protein
MISIASGLLWPLICLLIGMVSIVEKTSNLYPRRFIENP